jgi:hypothetical protein
MAIFSSKIRIVGAYLHVNIRAGVLNKDPHGR